LGDKRLYQGIRRWIANPVGLTEWDNVTILVHVSLASRGSGRLDTRLDKRQEVVTAPRSPWQNAYVERIIGSIRRETPIASLQDRQHDFV